MTPSREDRHPRHPPPPLACCSRVGGRSRQGPGIPPQSAAAPGRERAGEQPQRPQCFSSRSGRVACWPGCLRNPSWQAAQPRHHLCLPRTRGHSVPGLNCCPRRQRGFCGKWVWNGLMSIAPQLPSLLFSRHSYWASVLLQTPGLDPEHHPLHWRSDPRLIPLPSRKGPQLEYL